MEAMDPNQYHNDIVQGYETLCQIDPKRKGYYQDQRSKCIVAKALEEASENEQDVLDLSSKGLTCVYFKERLAFFKKIDLSDNHIKCINSAVAYFKECEELILDKNQLTDLKVEGLPVHLKTLSMKYNPVCDNTIAKLKSIVALQVFV